MPAPSSIMVLRPGALGDALLTLPFLHACTHAGATRLALWGTPPSWAWVNPHARELRVLDGQSADWLALFSNKTAWTPRALEALRGVDAAVAFFSKDDPAARAALKNAGVKEVIFARPPLAGEKTPEGAADPHAAARLMEPLRRWLSDEELTHLTKIALEAAPPEGWFAAAEARTRQVFETLGLDRARPLLAVHPGSGGRAKCWPPERYVELLARASKAFDAQLAVLLGPAEAELAGRFDERLRAAGVKATPVVDRPLADIHALLRGARLFLGNDAGVTHLAARACATVALFGPTDPRVWRPLGAEVHVVSAFPGSMEDLAVDRVWEAVQSAWREATARRRR